MGRPIVAGIVALLVAATVSTASRGQTYTTASVAAWNVNGATPITVEKAQRIAAAIVGLDPDVIVLSDVSPSATVDQIAQALQELGARYQYAFPNQASATKLALFHRNGVELSQTKLIPGSNADDAHLRHAVAATFRIGQFDFVLVAVHLKAGRTERERSVRDTQVAMIAGYVDRRTAEAEKDVLVLGDFNMRPDQDGVNFAKMNPDLYLRFLSTEDLADQISHIAGCDPHRGSLLDGYAIAADHTQEYVEGSMQIVPIYRVLGMDCETFREEVSDHLPVIARFRITRDDD